MMRFDAIKTGMMQLSAERAENKSQKGAEKTESNAKFDATPHRFTF